MIDSPVSRCEHPKMFYSKRAGKEIYVSCGKCFACRQARKARWAERLKEESKCHIYTQVIYLDYNDSHIPRYDFDEDSSFIVESTPRLKPYYDKHPELYRIELNTLKFEHDYDFEYVIDRLNGCASGLAHPSVYDIQLFKKRLATKIKREVTGKYACIRSAIVAEIGPTTLRPHYHGILFFDDERILQELPRLVRDCWTDNSGNVLGTAKAEPDKGHFASYVAKYVTKSAPLPAVYEIDAFKPFFLTSRHPPIGSLCTGAQNRYLFDNCSPVKVEIQSNGEGLSVSLSPLGQSLENRLYPKCPLYGKVSVPDRVKLYRLIFDPDGLPYVSYDDFLNTLLNRSIIKTEHTLFDYRDFHDKLPFLKADLDQGYFIWKNDVVSRLVKELCGDYTSECSFHMLYACGLRILKQSRDFGYTFNGYVRNIIEYWDYKKPQYQLRQFYKDLEDRLFQDPDLDQRFFYPLTYYRSGVHPEEHESSVAYFDELKVRYFEKSKNKFKNDYFESRRLKEYDYDLYCLIKKYYYAKECDEVIKAIA